MKKIFLMIFFLSFATLVQAAGSVSGKVKNVRVDRSGWGIVEFDKLISTPGGCVSDPYTSHFSFDANTVGGKAIYSMALAAAASGKTITAYGTGSCEEYADIVESMSYAHFQGS